MIRYQYVTAFSPPAPFVHVVFRNPKAEHSAGETPAQLDCAADRTVIPGRLVDELQLTSVRQIMVEGLGGDVHSLCNAFVGRVSQPVLTVPDSINLDHMDGLGNPSYGIQAYASQSPLQGPVTDDL